MKAAPQRAAAKPAVKKPGKPRPGVERGDEVYFKAGDQHTHGRVASHGAHGCHIDHEGGRARVYWEDILGHKSRSAKSAKVVNQGDDGFLMEDDHGRRRFVAGEAPAPERDDTPGDHDAVLEHARRGTPLAKALGQLDDMMKAHVGPYQRNGKTVNAVGYDRTSQRGKGEVRRVPVRPSVLQWAGIEQKPVMADYAKLAEKHPEYFDDSASAMHHVEWVMEHPNVFIPATEGRFVMFIRRGSVDKCVVIDPTVKFGGKGYSVRSAYIMNADQVKEYLRSVWRNEKGRVLMRKSLGAGSLHPGLSRTSAFGISSAESATGQQTDQICSSRWLPAPRDADQPSDLSILDELEKSATFEGFFEMYKSISPDPDEPRVLFFKGGPLANRPGLTQKKLTDKAGHQTTRWVRTAHDAPANDNGGAKPAGPKPGAYGTHDIQPGSRVRFKAGEHEGEGEVTAVGEHGLTAKDGAGREHQVLHHEVTHFKAGEGVKKPEINNEVLGEQKQIPADQFGAADYAKSHDKADVTPASVLANFPADTADRIAAAQDRLKDIEDTLEANKKDGKWSAQREVLHAKIMSELFSPESVKNATPEEGEKPKFIILGGRGGSGKSSFAGAVYDPQKSIVLDADHIKGMLPEYEGWNAFAVHNESGEIFDNAVRIARELGLNVVLDKTLKTARTAIADVQAFKDAGYRTEAHYMHLPRQEAAKRAVGRFLGGGEQGRYVPIEVVLANTTNEAAFDQVKGMVDAWSFRDNNVPKGAKPILVSQSGGAAAGGQSANENAPAAKPDANPSPNDDAPNLHKSHGADTMILLFRRK